MAPDYLSHWPVDWFKCDWEDRKVGDTPKLTKWSHDIVSDDCEKSPFPAAIFSPPAAAALI
jgi:hypothetical protein